jgi:pimeloyl-ACP methyl ester carboxylesterase
MAACGRLLTALLSGALLIAACQSTVAPTAVPGTPSAAPGNVSAEPTASGAAVPPTFAATPCPDDVTANVVVVVSCGYLTVLEDRAKPAGRTIELFVARFEPPGGTTTPDPAITLGNLGGGLDYGGMAPGGQRMHRVLYLLDPRGIGHSKPSLDCPEVAAIGPDIAAFRLRDPARQTILLGAVTACHDRLVAQGIDLAAYGLAADANDMEDLRTTLGISKWTINSNGSANRIAFEVARTFPDGVRAMVIASPTLPSPDFLTIGPVSLDLAIAHLAAACAAQPVCAQRFPDLPAMIRNAVTRLDKNPLTLDVSGTVDAIRLGHPIRVVVDGAALVRIFRFGIGTAGGSETDQALATIADVLDGKLSGTESLVRALAADTGDCVGILASCDQLSVGAAYSIVCRDLAGQIDTSQLAAAIDGRSAYADVFAPSPLLAPCGAWGVPPVAASVGGSLTGGVPMLVLRGTFDPFSPPMTEVAAAAAGAPSVYLLDIPNQSYNPLGYNECVAPIRNAWVDAPTSPPADTSCLTTIPTINLAP